MMWMMLVACEADPQPEPEEPAQTPKVEVTEPTPSPTGDSGSSEPYTGVPPIEPVNLLVNGDFEAKYGGWSHRQGIVGRPSAAPDRSGQAWFVNDDDSNAVSWTWSDPVAVEEGRTYCLRADTYKTLTDGTAFPNVWARFFVTTDASVQDRILEDASGNSLDVQTMSDNRYADEDQWVPVDESFVVPSGLGIQTLRVLLSSNNLPIGQLWFDDVELFEGSCPKR